MSLSTKLLMLTIAFVMLAEILIFLPSVANYRRSWLTDRITAAQIASLALEAAPDTSLPLKLRKELLTTAGVLAVAVRRDDLRQLVLKMDKPRAIDATYDLRSANFLSLIADGVALFFAPDGRMIRVIGEPAIGASNFVEIVMDERPLKAAILTFGLNVLLLSIAISLMTAALVYLTLNALLVRPVKRITWNMVRFRQNPEDRSRIIMASRRGDEIGMAERELAQMQGDLAALLQQKSHLASLGLAVSKINHDLRNMLASAQIISDRVATSPDPTVQRLAPKLIASLDRAIQLCTETLKYGKSSEEPPKRTLFELAPLVHETAESIGLAEHPLIRWRESIEPGLEIDADEDQLFRILSNLLRNAAQILEKSPANGAEPEVSLTAKRDDGLVTIIISDTGPGVPDKARENLFEPFKSSSRDGGTGLGLAISAELARLHGGQLVLEPVSKGAAFRLNIPDAEGGGKRRRSRRRGSNGALAALR